MTKPRKTMKRKPHSKRKPQPKDDFGAAAAGVVMTVIILAYMAIKPVADPVIASETIAASDRAAVSRMQHAMEMERHEPTPEGKPASHAEKPRARQLAHKAAKAE